ncbi:autotransporter outer membrane beta-barrel domain-containing protein [Pseudodesulfovibrio sp. S3]|nr:autotransporter outer membrane beta-barrel domain-containing protein [Pseudodesulfovibrio sp. S3]
MLSLLCLGVFVCSIPFSAYAAERETLLFNITQSDGIGSDRLFSFVAGEKIRCKVVSASGTTHISIVDDLYFKVAEWMNIVGGDVFEYTVVSDGDYRIWTTTHAASSCNVNYYSVTDGPDGTSGETKNAFSNTVASASRGQTSVITGNIMSRTATASFGAPPQEARGRNLASSFNKGSLYQRGEQHEAREMSIKELGQFATFNTSQSVAAAADGGVSGIEQRRGILTSDPFTIWGHASFTSADNDFNKGGDDRRYNGNVWGYSLGADYRFHEKVIAGLSVGYTDTDITTSYNSGKYEEQSWNFSPYVMYEPVDGALISFIAGYSFGDVDRKRNSTVTGNTDSDMWYTALEGEYRMQPSDSIPLELTARLGYLLSEKTLDAFTESDGTRVGESTADTSQIKPGVEVAYSFNAQGMTLQPFVKADYIHDFVDEINDDSNALNLGGGLRVLSGETGLSGVIEGERQFCRDDYSEYTIKGLLAYNFALNGDDGNQVGTLAPFVNSNLDADGGQVFGAGLKFTSADGVMSCELDATHTMSSEDAGNTGARMMLEMAY